MTNILVLYASAHGTTERIATFIAARLRSLGHHVDLVDARTGSPARAGYGAVVIGSRVRFGRHARSIRRFVTEQRQALGRLQGAFFSVSMSAARGGNDPALARFFAETRWRPALWTSLAGEDSSRERSFNDWAAVHRLADTFASRLSEPMPLYPWRPADVQKPPISAPR
jgi:menaquinone-dependent protoporphyrinogen oxidase